jgi:hypothetical protein
MDKTARGFDITEFLDCYGNKCSLQKSSIATQDCIWFGVDDPKPKRCVEFPKDTWMHLTRDQVKELLPYLKNFVKTGELT